MRKFTRALRDNSRVLLLVFMSLLLVVFLLGDVIGRGGRDHFQDLTLGTAFGGEPVKLSQVNAADMDWESAGELMPELRLDVIRRDLRLSSDLIYLLMREAELAGVRVATEQLSARVQADQDAVTILEALRRRQGRSLEAIYAGAGRALAVLEYLTLQIEGAAGESVPQLEQDYQQQSQSAVVKYSVIDARALLSLVAEPTPEELDAHFAEARDRNTQHSTDSLAFGYRVPERVEIEYLTVDPRDIINKIIVRDRELKRFYDENQQRYTKRVAQSQPATLPDGAPPPPPQIVQMTLEEAREQVKNDARQALASEAAQTLVNRAHDELRRPWAAGALGSDGRRAAPAEPPPSLDEVRAKLSTDYPLIYRKTNLVDRAELQRDPDLNTYFATIEGRRISLAQQAFHAEPLTDGKAFPSLPLLRLGEPSNVFVSMRGTKPYQSLVFRIVQAIPAGPPASLDEVRTQALENWKLAKAFALAGDWARKLGDAAKQQGLDAAVTAATELTAILNDADNPPPESQPTSAPATDYVKALGPHTQEKFTRRSSTLPFGVQNVKLPTEIFALSDSAAAPESHKIVTLPVAGNFRWVIAELVQANPIYQGQFELQRARQAGGKAQQRSQMFVQTWVDPAHVALRTEFVAATPVQAPGGP